MCCGGFIAKYVLFFFNLVFTLAGLGLVGLGIAALVQASNILELIPVNINLIPIAIIVIGAIIFVIAFFGCCGAIRESRCLLIMYAICMIILAALKVWLAVEVFRNLSELQATVTGWLNNAFDDVNLRGPFGVMEVAFRCCGTFGPGAYEGSLIPDTCCSNENVVGETCPIEYAFERGCSERLGGYFETFGEAIGAVIIAVIVVELVAMLLAFFLNSTITQKRKNYRV